VPRWFTEGLAVHEEGAASSDWADRMTPEIVVALQKKQLLPILELDRGFVRPQYPTQVIVSYYQAGKICDYIAEKWGDGALLGIIHGYAARKSTAEVIEDNLHESAASFDKDFAVWLDQKTGNTVSHFDEWKRGLKAAYVDLQNGKKEEAAQQALTVQNFYPEYVGADSGYELTADFYLSKGDRAAALKELEQYRNMGGKSLQTLKKLARVEQESGDAKQAQVTLEKLNYVYPEDEEIHRKLSSLFLESGDASGAVLESKAVLALKPADAAESHYELAKALHAAHRLSEAKDQVVLALESAPGLKPAQQLLLQLSQ
jgi:predicted Zn-dependent protease